MTTAQELIDAAVASGSKDVEHYTTWIVAATTVEITHQRRSDTLVVPAGTEVLALPLGPSRAVAYAARQALPSRVILLPGWGCYLVSGTDIVDN